MKIIVVGKMAGMARPKSRFYATEKMRNLIQMKILLHSHMKIPDPIIDPTMIVHP